MFINAGHAHNGLPDEGSHIIDHTRIHNHMALPEVHEAVDEQDIALCFPVVQTLRVHFTCQADFVSRVVRQRADGYHLMYIADGGQVQAIAGYRIREHLETPDPRWAPGALCMLFLKGPCMVPDLARRADTCTLQTWQRSLRRGAQGTGKR